MEPPVTKGTLSELDINKIINNPKLRHDINFDPDLYFRPNLDGEKGRRKTQKANEFWGTMQAKLREYLMDREKFESKLGDIEWCLPTALKAIREILGTLVEENFNVDLLMQQFRKGVLDLQKLAIVLSQLLKCRCAPMRDGWVDEMVTQLSNGDRNGDVNMLVGGLQNLLSILEAMKLDVANHQIRCLRALLIEDTVHFEQKFLMKKIAMGKADIAGAHAWFKRASGPDAAPVDASGNTWDFFKALVNLTLPSKSPEVVPHTFLFDEERLIKLRSELLHTQDFANPVKMAMGWNPKPSSPRYRRGRGPRRVGGLNGSDDPQDPDFFNRDIEIRSQGDSPLLARCRLDSQCHIPFLMSADWAKENGKLSQISKDFKDPGMQSVSGHKIQIDGILRNVVFNLRGSTVTYRRDVYVCKQLNGWADMVIGAKFMAEQFAVLFSKAKKMFAGIFSFKKETAEEKAKGKLLQEEADLEAEELELQLRIKKAKEARRREEARKKREEEERRRQNGGQ